MQEPGAEDKEEKESEQVWCLLLPLPSQLDQGMQNGPLWHSQNWQAQSTWPRVHRWWGRGPWEEGGRLHVNQQLRTQTPADAGHKVHLELRRALLVPRRQPQHTGIPESQPSALLPASRQPCQVGSLGTHVTRPTLGRPDPKDQALLTQTTEGPATAAVLLHDKAPNPAQATI